MKVEQWNPYGNRILNIFLKYAIIFFVRDENSCKSTRRRGKRQQQLKYSREDSDARRKLHGMRIYTCKARGDERGVNLCLLCTYVETAG